ncbi:MAG TPA: oligosaccharide flippase family protein, partial [Ktedonobacteraceae bacterium]|nr:oligosaccharide flippase family protein [Ktedonobacteraceae bacterium]
MALLDKAIKRTGIIQQARLQHLLALLTGKARRNAAASTEQAAEEYILHLLNLLKDSGIYALSSLASPLVALVLAPFLTRYLSRPEYGALAVLNITISLIAACTQLGMATSFFRAYNWDYETQGDRFAIFTTSLLLLLLVSTPVLIVMYICAPWLSALLLGSAAFSSALKITALVIFVQNLALPLLLWLRAEKRALLFSLLSICNLLVTLVGTLFFVGVLHMGIDGSLLASAGGYLILVLSICPVVFSQLKKGLSMRPRMDITHNLLRFGIP